MTKCYCKAGYYSPDGSGTDYTQNCQQCPTGKTSSNLDLNYYWSHDGWPNWYSCQNCNGYTCGLDFSNLNNAVSPTLNKKCFCIRNYYKNPSVAVPTESSNDCLQCPEGSATTDYDGTSCTICDIGYYSPNGLAPCAKCPDGKTTNGYQQTSCTVTSTYAPTAGPTPSPTPSSPSITNAPIALPTRAPARSKRPTAQPTMRPTQANACPQGTYHIYIINRNSYEIHV